MARAVTQTGWQAENLARAAQSQVQIYKRDQAEADRLAQAVGHRDAFSARRQNAK
jgi:hypothetical protein